MPEWWQLSGTTSTAQSGAPVIQGSTGIGGITTCSIDVTMLKNYTLTSCKMALGAIASQNASDNLFTKSVVVPVPINPAAGATLSSTGYVLWIPPTNCTPINIRLLPVTAWQLTSTEDHLQVFTCNAGVIADWWASSTGSLKTAGESYWEAGSGVQATNFSANVPVRLAYVAINACSDPGELSVQIDYTTTG